MPRKRKVPQARGEGRRQERPLGTSPARLRRIREEGLGSMAPGDVIFLEEAAMLRGVLESLFFAVLACPVCGTPGMVSAAQCRGLVPVTCGAGKCSCRFRIDADGSLVYLLVN